MEQYTELFEEILKLETLEECQAFFDDLCTYKELDSMTERIRAAKLLLEGSTYTEVQNKTGISSATLARVSRCIQHGSNGYLSILKKKS